MEKYLAVGGTTEMTSLGARMGCRGRSTYLLSCLRSTHNLRTPVGFLTTVRGWTDSVGLVTRAMTPLASKESSSSLVCSRMAIETGRRHMTLSGTASGCKAMRIGSPFIGLRGPFSSSKMLANSAKRASRSVSDILGSGGSEEGLDLASVVAAAWGVAVAKDVAMDDEELTPVPLRLARMTLPLMRAASA